MTKECTICSNKTAVPCSSLAYEDFRNSCARDCLLRQRDSLRAQVHHLHAHISHLSSMPFQPNPPAEFVAYTDWLNNTQITSGYKISHELAFSIQKAILDAITAAAAKHSPSVNDPGPTLQSPPGSPNPIDAKWDGALVDETGARPTKTACPVCNNISYEPGYGCHNCDYAVKENEVRMADVEGLAKQDGTSPSAALKWIEGEHTIFDYNGQYGIFQSDRGWRCKYYNKPLGWHRNLANAKADCETHYLASKDNAR